MQIKNLSRLSTEEREEILMRGLANLERVLPQVTEIVAEVKRRGDQALVEYTKRFDGVKLDNLKVSAKEITKAKVKISNDLINSLRLLKGNLARYHRLQIRKDYEIEIQKGVKVGRKIVPLEAVGCYVPKGYPSSLLMATVPAKLCGVKRIAVFTPPDQNGNISPSLLFAASIARVDEIYKVGGAQAIAAMTFGTESIKPVPKIVGPGNIYVTAAKKLMRDEEKVDIDFLAGPSEIAIIIQTADNLEINKLAKFTAADILAQLEHGPHTRAILLSDNLKLAKQVVKGVQQDREQPVGEVEILTYKDLDSATRFINDYAPEHLEIMSKDPKSLLNKIKNVGSVFLGLFSPVTIGDYCSGTNHILPTMGRAKFSSGLGIGDFIKEISYQELSKEGLEKLARPASELSKAEDMKRHGQSITIRLSKDPEEMGDEL